MTLFQDDQSLYKKIQELVKKVPGVSEKDTRDLLVRAIPEGARGTLKRSEIVNADLDNIIKHADECGQTSEGNLVLKSVLESIENIIRELQLNNNFNTLIKDLDNYSERKKSQFLYEANPEESQGTSLERTIFISDADDDEVREYHNLAKSLVAEDFGETWRVFDRQELNLSNEEAYKTAISNSNIYVGILGSNYGAEYNDVYSHTEYEYRIASRKVKKVIILRLSNERSVKGRQKTFYQAVINDQEEHPDTITVEDCSDLQIFRECLYTFLRELQLQEEIATSHSSEIPFIAEYTELNSPYDQKPVLVYKLKDLDPEQIGAFREKLESRNEFTTSEQKENRLRMLGLDSNEALTVGAFLCFAPFKLLGRKFFAACRLRILVHANSQEDKTIERERIIENNLLNLYSEGKRVILEEAGLQKAGLAVPSSQNTNSLTSDPTQVVEDQLDPHSQTQSNPNNDEAGLQRARREETQSEKEKFIISDEALCEALINALIHRDYESDQAKNEDIQIYIHPNRIEIVSFGRLLLGITERELNNPSKSRNIMRLRNSVIAEIFKIMGDATLNGQGIKRMFAATQRSGLPLPEVIQNVDYVTVILRKYPDTLPRQLTIPYSEAEFQDPRSFTVKIRVIAEREYVGTGIIISSDGKIVTCAHIIKQAGVDLNHSSGVEISIYFPQILNETDRWKPAEILTYCSEYNDDIILLQLTSKKSPLLEEQIAHLGTPEHSLSGNQFVSYGFRKLDEYTAGRADGIILGKVDIPDGRNLRIEPIQLKSSLLDKGMSGAAVLDIKLNLVVGIVCEVWHPRLLSVRENNLELTAQRLKDRDTAWAVNVEILKLPPFNLSF